MKVDIEVTKTYCCGTEQNLSPETIQHKRKISAMAQGFNHEIKSSHR